jgi:hypothetical protein
MYYLNAFNDMLRKRRQQNNMMNGGGQDYPSRDYARPSGTDALGLGPAQDRNAFRDTLNSMSPMSQFAMGMVPGIGTAFNVGRLVDAGMSAYESSQLAPSRDTRERAQDQFRASEISEMNAPAYGQAGPDFGPYPNSSVDPSAYEGAISENSFNAFNMGGTAPLYTDDSASRLAGMTPVGMPVSQRSLAIESLPTMATDTIGQSVNFGSLRGEGQLQSGGFNSTGLYGDASAGMGSFGGADVGFGGGFGGNIGTGNFGGNPADAADMGYAHGGMVDARHLKGRAPAPDDGYGALQGGEYVITKAAVEKYGKRLLDAINNGTFR